MIVNYFITNDIQLTTNITNNIADSIISNFPNEVKVLFIEINIFAQINIYIIAYQYFNHYIIL